MSLNIIIGIGGTGAKIIEAVIHMGAAGLAPGNLHVGFVDQDKGNGNVGRAAALLATVSRARQLLRGNGQPHRVDDPSSLFASQLQFLGPEPGVWTPHHDGAETLASIFGDMPDDRPLFDLLYEPGPAEQEMNLSKGYRGHPPIGSAAITSATLDESAFWGRLHELLQQNARGHDVRLLLAGSVFGGTGAAGFPTMARLIRRQLEREGFTKNVSIGGILMLPYFGFSPPKSEHGEAGNVARSEKLLIQARGALRYYEELFQREAIFNELYLVGWDRTFDLGYHEPGGNEQCNPALLPELIAALGACRFFDESRSAAAGTNEVIASARADSEAVEWTDLPSPIANEPEAVYGRLGRLLRFAATSKFWLPLLSRGSAVHRAYRRQFWYRLQQLGRVDFVNQPPTAELEALGRYVDALLQWAGSIQAYASASGLRFNLWSVDDLMDGAVRSNDPTNPVVLKRALSEPQHRDAFNKLVKSPPGRDAPPSVTALISAINERRVDGRHEGVGRLIAALHRFSDVTTEAAA